MTQAAAPSLGAAPGAAEAPARAPLRAVAVLPEKERFSPDAAGAVALMLRDMAAEPQPGQRLEILGWRTERPPFEGCGFRPLSPSPLRAALFGKRAAYAAAVRAALRALRPDIVQVHNRPALALSLARALAPVPVLLSLHNHADTMPAGRSAAERARLAERLAAIVCICEHVRGRFLDGLPERLSAKVVTIHRGLRPESLPAPRPAALRRPEFLFVGRLNAEKGADVFLRAARLALPALPGWSARMIGSAWYGAGRRDSAFLAALRAEAAAAGVALPGFLPNEAALAAMAEAAVVVLPSRWSEPFARVALEALACGAALVASPRGGIPEAVGEAAIYADPEDPEALAQAMRRLAADSALREALQRRGLAQAARFPMARTAAAYAALRRRLVGG
ncbi:MAG: glycosyltransferase family 4 protein [Acetobacteraceae bacterium]|nr:glycosyltransferase family 4 protein [Acetobacteraceae bacterium]